MSTASTALAIAPDGGICVAPAGAALLGPGCCGRPACCDLPPDHPDYCGPCGPSACCVAAAPLPRVYNHGEAISGPARWLISWDVAIDGPDSWESSGASGTRLNLNPIISSCSGSAIVEDPGGGCAGARTGAVEVGSTGSWRKVDNQTQPPQVVDVVQPNTRVTAQSAFAPAGQGAETFVASVLNRHPSGSTGILWSGWPFSTNITVRPQLGLCEAVLSWGSPRGMFHPGALGGLIYRSALTLDGSGASFSRPLSAFVGVDSVSHEVMPPGFWRNVANVGLVFVPLTGHVSMSVERVAPGVRVCVPGFSAPPTVCAPGPIGSPIVCPDGTLIPRACDLPTDHPLYPGDEACDCDEPEDTEEPPPFTAFVDGSGFAIAGRSARTDFLGGLWLVDVGSPGSPPPTPPTYVPPVVRPDCCFLPPEHPDYCGDDWVLCGGGPPCCFLPPEHPDYCGDIGWLCGDDDEEDEAPETAVSINRIAADLTSAAYSCRVPFGGGSLVRSRSQITRRFEVDASSQVEHRWADDAHGGGIRVALDTREANYLPAPTAFTVRVEAEVTHDTSDGSVLALSVRVELDFAAVQGPPLWVLRQIGTFPQVQTSGDSAQMVITEGGLVSWSVSRNRSDGPGQQHIDESYSGSFRLVDCLDASAINPLNPPPEPDPPPAPEPTAEQLLAVQRGELPAPASGARGTGRCGCLGKTANAVRGAGKYAKAKVTRRIAPPDEVARRRAICQGCATRRGGWCGPRYEDRADHPDPAQRSCGCRLGLKTECADESCPQGKWGRYVGLTIGGA